MIGAFATTYIVCWVYQAGIRSDSPNTVKWVLFVTALFFGIQLSWNVIDAFFIFSESRPIFEPLIAGFIIVALIRTKLVMREKLTLGNLFSHMNIFASIDKLDSTEF